MEAEIPDLRGISVSQTAGDESLKLRNILKCFFPCAKHAARSNRNWIMSASWSAVRSVAALVPLNKMAESKRTQDDVTWDDWDTEPKDDGSESDASDAPIQSSLAWME